jgi:hypothetical protein
VKTATKPTPDHNKRQHCLFGASHQTVATFEIACDEILLNKR